MPSQLTHFMICVDNSGYHAALELRKLYRTIPDRTALAKGYIRVIDESGEDYLYAASRFAPVTLPPRTKRALARTG
jgi:hypothetical protein